MSDLDDNENTLTSRHKKERKELQSKIQSLKKSASKGDKKKRKEVLDEISKIEVELAKRHSEELNNVNNAKNISKIEKNDKSENIETADEICDDVINNLQINDEGKSESDLRISKAQRRREKKAQKEKEKEAEIAAEEGQYKNGPRIQEMRSLKKILKDRGLSLFTIPSDGDCLYNAICHQLSMIGHAFGPCAMKNNESKINQIQYLRNETANYIENNKDTLIYYMSSQGTGELMSDDEFEIYCNQIRNTSAWGGQIEIRAIANILKARIEVLQASGPPTVQECDVGNERGPTLVITYHRHMYSLGEHYNSTVPYNEEEDFEDENEDCDAEIFF